MKMIHASLCYKIVSGDEQDTDILEVQSNNTLYVFNDLVNDIVKKCNADVVREAGGAIYEEWLVFLKSKQREVTASWGWSGISFSATGETNKGFLREIESVIANKRYCKPKLFFEKFFG
jgi:hypothetical protein